MKVRSLHVYPVKALRGLSRETAAMEGRGLAGDRRIMIVDDAGVFLTQREAPGLATIAVEEDNRGVVLSGPEGTIRPLPRLDAPKRRVRVWDDTLDAVPGDARADARLSSWLGRPLALVHMDEEARRPVTPEWDPTSETSFADGFPVLVIATASLAALNDRLAARGAPQLPMERFRPNLVVETDVPFIEDTWTRIAVGSVTLDLVKPCARCVVTTTDQATGHVAEDNEPLATLATFRRSMDRRAPGVLFGWNAVVRTTGIMSVGAPVSVVESRAAWPVG